MILGRARLRRINPQPWSFRLSQRRTERSLYLPVWRGCPRTWGFGGRARFQPYRQPRPPQFTPRKGAIEPSPAKPLTLALPYSNKEGCRSILPPRTEIANPPAKKAGVGGEASTMKLRKQSGVVLTLATLIAIVLLGSTADAQAYRVIYDFGQKCPSPSWPVGIPAVAKNGDLYGVTEGGGGCNGSAIYKLTAPQTRGGAWTETVLYEYTGNTEFPVSLVIDKDGALYGTGEGPGIRGFIFRLTPPISGHGPWTYQTLYTFKSNADGSGPEGNLVFDAEGNLYGATELAG